MDVYGIVAAGGPVLVVLMLLSIASVTLIVGKAWQMRGALGDAPARRQALARWGAGDRSGALEALGKGRGPADRLLAEAMRGIEAGRSRAAIETDLEWRGNAEMAVLQKHLRLLDLIGMISPLLGLLGTVMGMIQAFQNLAAAEGAANASILAGGIWEALLTTAAGLIVAIPASLAAGLMADRADRAAAAAEATIGQFFAQAF